MSLKGQKALDRFIEHYEADKKSKKTIRYYRDSIKHMLKFIDKEPENITLDDIENWKRQGLKDFKKSSVRTYIRVAKIFLRYIGKKELVSEITMPKKEKHIPVYLTQNEASMMLEKQKITSETMLY